MRVRTVELDASTFSNIATLEDPSRHAQAIHAGGATEFLTLTVIDLLSSYRVMMCGCVEFASCIRSTCAMSIDVHGLILTDVFAYAHTIQETGDGQTKRVVTSTERRNNHSSEPLINVQESNVPFCALNNIIPSLPLHRPEPTPSAIP